ncbi:GAF domain-containing protein [Murinocardiopsis flavida]|uniref:GAF domain-containing protein n=1 Tax=Murinocardiopsis flavida TaxID=645275 RepID=A0A2P8DIZ2_9ACTN|nr:helix-turn-helix domain-containing protein [Murinocardiopsis flavida]PSK97196.1 GAF domain-containing protein [Murinocardiopsis flavida]
MMDTRLDTAVPAGADPAQYARLLHRVHEAAVTGAAPPARPRTVIGDSWLRMRARRIDPDGRTPGPVLSSADLARCREDSPLAGVLPMLRHALTAVAEDAGHMMVIADDRARILWRDGPGHVRRLGDRLGFVEGSSWDENDVGTNAIGTALVVRRPTQVYSAEHYVRGHHSWTCACAPVHDPRDGTLLGAVDVSGPLSSNHPSTLALVGAVATLAESHLRGLHHAHLEELRVVAAPMLAGMREQALVVDSAGWTAAAVRMAPVRRLLLPEQLDAGVAWLPSLGECRFEPLPGGWLVRPLSVETAGAAVATLDVARPAALSLRVVGPSGEWSHRLSPRHAELLYVLAAHREGRSAAQLSQDLFGGAARTVTVRAEMSRLRRHLGGVIASRPYRFADGVEVRVVGPPVPGDLLPHSGSPEIRRLRCAGLPAG